MIPPLTTIHREVKQPNPIREDLKPFEICRGMAARHRIVMTPSRTANGRKRSAANTYMEIGTNRRLLLSLACHVEPRARLARFSPSSDLRALALAVDLSGIRHPP